MQIDLTIPITNLDGTPIPEAGGKPMTVKSVFCAVLTTQKPNDTITGVEKVRRYELATRIYTANVIDLGIDDDIKLLRDLVADGYVPLVVGQIWRLFDESPTEPAEEPPPDGVDTKDGIL